MAHRVFWKDRRWSEQNRRGGVARTGRISGAIPLLRLRLSERHQKVLGKQTVFG